MFSQGLYQRKFIYPSLFLLFLLLLLSRYAAAVEVTPPHTPATPKVDKEKEKPEDPWSEVQWINGHSEKDFIDASEAFNNNLAANLRTDGDRMQRNENRLASFRRDWERGANKAFNAEEYRARYNDARYQQALHRLDSNRNRDLQEYHGQRNAIERRMSGSNRASADYDRLTGELRDLDRDYVRTERDYERRFKNLDAEYSSGGW